MKRFIPIFVVAALVVIIVVYFKALPREPRGADFSGEWILNPPEEFYKFTLILQQSGSEIKGYHCILKGPGEQQDCYDSEEHYTVTGTVTDNTAAVRFLRTRDSSYGTATLRQRADSRIEWFAPGESEMLVSGFEPSFFPERAFFIRQQAAD